MQLLGVRYNENHESTVGILFVDQTFICHTLEDIYNDPKIPARTRIPSGTYPITLRTHGGFHSRYKRRFPFHQGMLEIENVPHFTDILIHCGVHAGHTAGCLLVGETVNNNIVADGKLTNSPRAYERLYPIVAGALIAGETVRITLGTPVELLKWDLTT